MKEMRYFMTVTVDRSVEEFTAAPRKLFIDGQWTDAASGKTFETRTRLPERPSPTWPRETPKTSTGPSAPPARPSRAARGAA
jgi:phenylacetaldehyde dehydrogenase